MTLIDKLINEHNQAVQYLEESSEKDGFLNGMKNAVKIAKNHSDWVSVHDELPVNSGDVLIYMASEDKQSVGNYCKENGWSGHYDSGWIDEVTHWQPLPKPPKA